MQHFIYFNHTVFTYTSCWAVGQILPPKDLSKVHFAGKDAVRVVGILSGKISHYLIRIWISFGLMMCVVMIVKVD